MSICITIIPPPQVIEAIRNSASGYISELQDKALESTWHMPLVFVDSMPSTEPLRQLFHQTLRILSIGEGEEKGKLWVRIQQSPSLTALRDSVLERLQASKITTQNTASFIPFMYLGSFEKIPAFGIQDTPLTSTFSIEELTIIQTDPYEILGTIALTS